MDPTKPIFARMSFFLAANARETKMKNVVKNIFVSLARHAAQFSILIGTESKFIDLKLEIALSTPYENIWPQQKSFFTSLCIFVRSRRDSGFKMFQPEVIKRMKNFL